MGRNRLAGLLIVLTLFSVQTVYSQQTPYPAAVLADAPVGYWRLNEPGTASDVSGRLNHGTYQGGLQAGVSGVTADGDAAVQSDGVDDYIAIPDSSSLSPSAAITVEAWIYLDSFPPSAGRLYRIAGKTNAYGLYLESKFAGSMEPEFIVQHPGQPTRSEVDGSRVVIKLHQWQHLVGTYDGGTSHLYVDGIDEGALIHSGPIADTTTPLWFSGPANNWSMPGKIDEVAVYPSALSPQQVAAHRAAATQFPPTPTPIPTTTPTMTPTSTSTATPTATATNTPTPVPTNTPTPSSGVICAGIGVGSNAVTLTCARDNTATPWPATGGSWPIPAGWP